MTTIIYHSNCVDGFTAAWICHRKFGDSARYIAAQYGDAPPDCVGDDVVIVDFSYPRAVLESLAARANGSLLVLDHHKSAEAELADLPFCKFDMTRSGAMMAQDEFTPPNERQPLVAYVQDRDLWQWKLPNSREVSAYIATVHKDFHSWDLLAFMVQNDLERVVDRGKALLRGVETYVDGLADQARIVTIGGYAVPCINTTYATSELVGRLAESNAASFAAGWFQKQDGQFVYSLRSRGDFDVAVIAKQYGGGGHRSAAGFTVSELLR